MGYGDELLAAGQAQRWFLEHQQRSVIVDNDHKPRWHPIWQGNPVIARPADARRGDHRIVNAPNARPYIVYPFTEYTGWTFNPAWRSRDHIARIYLTPEELQIGLDVYDRYGPYVLIEPWSKHDNLRWPMAHWRELVLSRPDLTFIQHIHQHSKLVPGITAAIQSTFRQACGLLSLADVYVRGESGMVHAAAALDIPSVTIWGGCMDWDVMGGYPKQIGVGITPPCCGSYRPCGHCAQIMAGISVLSVSAAIDTALSMNGGPKARQYA